MYEEKRILCDCSTCKLCCSSELDMKLETPKVLEGSIRKKRFDIDSSWGLTTGEANRV